VIKYQAEVIQMMSETYIEEFDELHEAIQYKTWMENRWDGDFTVKIKEVLR